MNSLPSLEDMVILPSLEMILFVEEGRIMKLNLLENSKAVMKMKLNDSVLKIGKMSENEIYFTTEDNAIITVSFMPGQSHSELLGLLKAILKKFQ